MSGIHLHSIVETQPAPHIADDSAAVFFVIQRQNGHWSPAAKIMSVHVVEASAEMEARRLKYDHPHQYFGVAALRSEARTVAEPIEIVRL